MSPFENPNITLSQAVDLLERVHPDAMKLANPRKYIVTDANYANPRTYALSLVSYLMCNSVSVGSIDHSSATCQFMAFELVKNQVPTYFIDRDFLEAVWQTTPPEGFAMKDVPWILPAMLLVLPKDFMREILGKEIPFAGICKVPKGKYKFSHPKLETILTPVPIENLIDRFCFHFPAYDEAEIPTDYTGTYKMEDKLENVGVDESFQDYTRNQSERQLSIYRRKKEVSNEESIKIINCLSSLMCKLLMALSTERGFVEVGQQIRKEKIRSGKILQSELWTPNFIGRKYKQERTNPQGGTHQSPRMHWRRGHFRNQKFGHNLEQTKLLWICPVLVNSSTE